MGFARKMIVILIGSLLISIGVNFFLVPFELLDGGGLGISLIIYYLFGVQVGLVFLIISIPIFILAWFTNRLFFYNGIHGLLFSSLMIDLLSPLNPIMKAIFMSPLIGASCGGLLIGAGVGLMLRFDVSIGGVDLFAQMLAKKMQVNSGLMILFFDIFIVTIGSLLLHSVYLILSLTTVLVAGITISLIVAMPRRLVDAT